MFIYKPINMINFIVLLFMVASTVLPIAAIVTVWTGSIIALKIMLTAGIVFLTTNTALNSYVENQGEDGVQ